MECVAALACILWVANHYYYYYCLLLLLLLACILWVAMSVARLVALFFSKQALSLAESKLSLT